jgi:2-dehydropantoate 2-reductase
VRYALQPVKIAIVGAGGVGGVWGGRLARAGCDVSFVARGAHLAALREKGLLVENETLGDIRLPSVHATDDPASIGVVDVVLVAVKLWDTEVAAVALCPMVGAHTAVISLQNGVSKDDVLRRAAGEQAVVGGVAYVAAHLARPGVIRHSGTMQRCIIGEYSGQRSGRVEALREALVRGGIEAEISDDIRRTTWEKYVFLVGLSGSTTTMRSPIGPIRAHPRARAFLLDLMQETVAVGRADGVNLPEQFANARMAFVDSMAPDMNSSMHHDLSSGNRLELPWLSGGVVRLGERLGVPTPANRAVCDILSLYSDGRKPLPPVGSPDGDAV